MVVKYNSLKYTSEFSAFFLSLNCFFISIHEDASSGTRLFEALEPSARANRVIMS